MVRYADDFVILCRTADDAQRALELVQAWVTENGLTLHPTKTRIVDVRSDGFDFLGYHFRGNQRGIRHWAREKSVQKLKDTLRPKTQRTSGQSLVVHHRRREPDSGAGSPTSSTADRESSASWTAGFGSDFARSCANAANVGASPRDGDFHRWRNAFFAEHGLFSLVERPWLGLSILTEVKPSTGEPDAGEPPVRFGGRGGRNQSAFPTPIKSQWVEFRPDGSLDFHVTVSGLNEISWWVLGYGDQAEVIRPPELRRIVAGHAVRMAQHYRSGREDEDEEGDRRIC